MSEANADKQRELLTASAYFYGLNLSVAHFDHDQGSKWTSPGSDFVRSPSGLVRPDGPDF